jgi:hypothetical protein
VREPHLRYRFSETNRFDRIIRLWSPVGDCAISTVPGTDIAQDHERRGLVFPAFTDVGTAGFLTDGMETELPHQSLDAKVIVATRGLHLEPQWLPGERSYDRNRTIAGCRGGTAELYER